MADKKISALTAATTPLAGTEVLPIVQSGSTVKVAISDVTAGRAISTTGITVSSNTGNIELNWAAGSTHKVGSSFSTAYFTGMRVDADTRNTDIVSFDASGTGNVRIRTGVTETTRLNVDPTGNITASTGNLVIGTAAKGIDFSANTNAPGMTSELLNWYEEGTWTPTFTGLTVGNGSVFGFYRRIGKQVFLTYGFILGSTSAVGSLTGLSGLPFTTGTVGGSRFFNATGVAFKQGVGGFPAYALLYSASTTGSGPASTNTNTGMSATAPFVWAADDSLSFTATYFVD
jgi:aspartate 1-decarboxylase